MIWSCSNDNSASTPEGNCINGFANDFPCNGIDFLSNISLETFEAQSANDSWGWTDPVTGNEYALIGLNNGLAFVDVTSPQSPVYLGKLPTHTDNAPWRDVKVFDNHAFIVSESTNHGMQVFDLTRLRDVTNTPQTFNEDAHYAEFGNAHNIIINKNSGFAYALGSDTFNGGPHFIDISNPTNPQPAGGYGLDDYSHDAQVVTYNGPDSQYAGQEIFIGSNENEIAIVNITDKANPESIATIDYNQIGYTHQGWFTEDQRYFILGDELDERSFGTPTRTLIFNLSDLDNPQLHFEYLGPTAAIDHNGYINGNTYYLANYTAGVRILDASQIADRTLTETAFFDTVPSTDEASFNGVWNVYPYLPSGTLIVTDIRGGLFLLKQQTN